MNQLINFISEINSQIECNNKELLKKIEYDNINYNNKYNIDIILLNPYYFNIEPKKKNKKALYMFCKLIDLENNLLKLIQHIPKNNYVYYIDFFGYGTGNKIDPKIIPDFKTLINKNIFILM